MLSLVWKVLIGQNIRASHDLIHCMAAHSPITELDSQISGLAIVKFQMRSSVRSRPTIYARAWCQLWCTMYSLTNFLAMSFFFNNLCHHHKTKKFPEINMKSMVCPCSHQVLQGTCTLLYLNCTCDKTTWAKYLTWGTCDVWEGLWCRLTFKPKFLGQFFAWSHYYNKPLTTIKFIKNT